MKRERKALAAALIIIATLAITAGLARFGREGSGRIAIALDAPQDIVVTDPHLLIGIQPRYQELAEGETAEFTVAITNTSAIPFTKVVVSGSGAANCIKGNAGALAVGQTLTYACSRENISDSTLVQLTASGQTNGQGNASDEGDAFVNVLRPGLRIIKRPESQLVRAGETARFNIVIFNNTASTVLTNVTVDDSGVPDCDLDPAIPVTLLPGDSRDYSCELPDVQEPSVGVATAEGTDPVEDVVLTATDVSWVELLAIEASLTADPTSVVEPGQAVTFVADVVNIGSVPVTLTSLSSVQFGNLLDANNPAVDDDTNTCLTAGPLPTIPPDGGRVSCSFVATVSGIPGNFNVILNASAETDEAEQVEASTSTAVTIVDAKPVIDVGVTADPNIVQAPGQNVVYTVRVDNLSLSDTVTITSLQDSILGSLSGRGSCSIPTPAIPVSGSYTCSFTTNVSGPAGTKVVRTITAVANDEDPGGPSATDSAEIEVSITDRPVKQILLPAVANDVVEPNDKCSQAYPLRLNKPYVMDITDSADLYAFQVPKAGKVRVEVTNFSLLDNQVSVHANPCPAGEAVVRDNTERANKVLEFNAPGPGGYWIYIFNAEPTRAYPPYGLIVRQD